MNLLHHAAAYSTVQVSDTTGDDSSNTVKTKKALSGIFMYPAIVLCEAFVASHT